MHVYRCGIFRDDTDDLSAGLMGLNHPREEGEDDEGCWLEGGREEEEEKDEEDVVGAYPASLAP